jgi:hypothetical protein
MCGANMRQLLLEDHNDKVGWPPVDGENLLRILFENDMGGNPTFLQPERRDSAVPAHIQPFGRVEVGVCRTDQIRAAQDRAAQIRAGQVRAVQFRAAQVRAA